MEKRLILCFISIFLFQLVSGNFRLCENNTHVTRSCTTQILGEDYSGDGSCKVEYIPSNSSKCKENFGPISLDYQIGQVSLKPDIQQMSVRRDNAPPYSINLTVVNISFTNIKWKTMKFRFQKVSQQHEDGHCRNIIITNNVTINDQSVLYYDCYWSHTYLDFKTQSHVLDFEATDDSVVNRGKIYFNMPAVEMLQEKTEENWKPFVYVEILAHSMKLHIVPPPTELQLKITAYQIVVMRKCEIGTQCNKIVERAKVELNNFQEVTYNFSLLVSVGSYHFVVTPIHEKCKNGLGECQFVESPRIAIDSEVHNALQVCIVSIASLAFGTIFVYFMILWCIRRYCCKDYYQEIPAPTKVLVIYSPTNRLHAACVGSFVAYLRSECGFDVLFDGDISNTTHGDPFVWAEEAYKLASHIIYVVGPTENTNLYNNIYDKPIIVYKDVDVLLLSLLRMNRTSRNPKQIMNVFFEHSNGTIPIETRHDKKFILLRDWQKLIAHLSKNLLPKKQIMRSKEGKVFLDYLQRASELSNTRQEDVIIRCDKNIIEKKVLL